MGLQMLPSCPDHDLIFIENWTSRLRIVQMDTEMQKTWGTLATDPAKPHAQFAGNGGTGETELTSTYVVQL
jgi:hypothetical protein